MVYLLYHRHIIDSLVYDDKLIGIYSSYEKAENAIIRYSDLPGFCDCLSGFHIIGYDVKPKKTRMEMHGMEYAKAVWVLFVEIVLEDEDDKITESYDIYSGRLSAAIGLVFKWLTQSHSVKRRFSSVKYIIDQDNWCEGFVTIN